MRRRYERNHRNRKKQLLKLLLCILGLGGGMFGMTEVYESGSVPWAYSGENGGAFYDGSSKAYNSQKTDEMISYEQAVRPYVAEGEMRVIFLDVGQGDCTIIRTGDANMVVDCGDKETAESVVTFLQGQEIETLDYLILTHPDADHIGGADEVLEQFDVKCVLMPDVANDTRAYEEVQEQIKKRRVKVEHPEVGAEYTLGDAVFQILCPEKELVRESDLNGSSVGIKLVHGKNSFVMCGDAEETSEQAMVKRFGKDLECDVLKCGHHGSSTATSAAFLKATDPTWAVISCGKGNSYGHPHAEVIAALEADDVQIYRTDNLGTIIACSDGKQLRWSAEKK